MATFKPKDCEQCGATFAPKSGRALRCGECRKLKPKAAPSRTGTRTVARTPTVSDVTLLDLLGRVKHHYKHASPETLKGAITQFVDARNAGERRAAALSLLDVAAVAIVLADRPDRIAMPPPTLAAA